MKGSSVRKKAVPKPGAPQHRVAYRSSAMADETRQMESELRSIQKAKSKEKEEDANRQRFAGGATWSRSGNTTSIRKYEKEFMSAVSSRPSSSTTGLEKTRPVSRERQVLDCSTNQSGVLKASRADGCTDKSTGLAGPAAVRRPKGLFDMPSLPEPPSKQTMLAKKAPPKMPEPSIPAPAPPKSPAAAAQAAHRAEELTRELDFTVQHEYNSPEPPAAAPRPPEEPTVFSSGFQALLQQELGGWQNPADKPPGGAWFNPGDESAIDAELAAAEARVAELRRLKNLKAAPAAPVSAAGWSNPADNAGGGWSNPADQPSNNSLWGSFDEAAQESAFADAVLDWRGGGVGTSTGNNGGAAAGSTGGSLWGTFDEEGQKESFQQAVSGWRDEGSTATTVASLNSVQAEGTSVEAVPAAKASCYQCYKLFWSDHGFTVPKADRAGDAAITAAQPFCGEQCWVKADSKAKISDAKKAARARANNTAAQKNI